MTAMDADLRARRTSPSKFYDAYLFDLDGTIYLGNDLLPGAKRLLETVTEAGAKIAFLSNNPTRDRQMYVTKLDKLGIQVSETNIINTIVSTVSWLKKNYPNATVFPIAEPPLIRALDEAGIKTSNTPSDIDIVIASYDRTFNYEKLQIAFDAIWQEKRAVLITTNPDRYCPFPGGRGEPDAAAIVAAIEASTGTRSIANMGKPDKIMIETVLSELGTGLENAIMVGDRLLTDVMMAHNAGIDSALVLTGDSQLADVLACPVGSRPTFILDQIDGLLPRPVANSA